MSKQLWVRDEHYEEYRRATFAEALAYVRAVVQSGSIIEGVPVWEKGDPHRRLCVTADGRNLHDEGYCDVHGQDYEEWRGV